MATINRILLQLCQLVYPIIPKIYSLIEALAEKDLFDSEQGAAIRDRIWTNLYIVLSIVVLFAIAVKLINAIVNPDVLTEKQKGAKTVYFKSVAAVFLIVLLPMLFSLLRVVQNDMFTNRIVTKIILGQDNINSDSGQILAIETARSFFEMQDGQTNPFDGATDVDAPLQALYDNQAYKAEDDQNYVKNFNPLVMLISGGFVVYQLITIVMDVAVRTIKLRILELMVPAIIGGFLFKTEILKAWFKEYIKTFLQVFLLLISVSLIAILLGLLQSVTMDPTAGFIMKAFIIFGILTMAKQAMPLINSIFGTNIKSKGGIKGRLGEMAAIGGLAQQAWSALGNKAKGIAGAAAGFAVGAAGAKIKGAATKMGIQARNQLRKSSNFRKSTKGMTPAERKAARKEYNKEAAKARNDALLNTIKAPFKGGPKRVIKNVANKGWRGLTTSAEILKTGFTTGGFAGGLKAGKDLSKIKVPNVMSQNAYDNDRSRANKRAAGREEDTGALSSETKQAFVDQAKRIKAAIDSGASPDDVAKLREKDTATANLKKAAAAEGDVLSGKLQNAVIENATAKGLVTDLKKADEARLAMGSILSSIGSDLSARGIDGSAFANLGISVSDKAGTANLGNILSQAKAQLESMGLTAQFDGALQTLANNQALFDNASTNIAANFDGVNMSTAKDLNGSITKATIKSDGLESDYKKVYDAANEDEKKALDRITDSGNTLFAMIPEHEKAEDLYKPSSSEGGGSGSSKDGDKTKDDSGDDTEKDKKTGGGSSDSDGTRVTADVDLSEVTQALRDINSSVQQSGNDVVGAVNDQGQALGNKLDDISTNTSNLSRDFRTKFKIAEEKNKDKKDDSDSSGSK